jgi:proteasome accessory factor B
MSADYARIHRLLRIFSLIQGTQGWDAKRLAKDCGVSVRTLYRDMKTLTEAGIPHRYDPATRCYQIDRAFFMKPVDLTLDEALALIALGEHIGGTEQIPFTRAAVRAVAKLRCQLPESLRRDLDGLDDKLAIRLSQSEQPDGAQDVYEKIRHALTSRTALMCRYGSPPAGNGAGAFEFRPYALLFSQRAWYAIGHHGGHKEVRCLRLSRFDEIKATDKAYRIPSEFSIDKHLGLAWRMIRGNKRYDVAIDFDAEFAETIADTHWHPTQEIEWHGDGSITFKCKVDGLDEIVWWVLSMGPHCRVKKPAELRQRVAELAAGIVKQYA